uniref:PAX-interacting protein 1 n=1 Tax=Macrostomum lignano TaxID=282301 RepID=A0A1I8HYX7_9PLAT
MMNSTPANKLFAGMRYYVISCSDSDKLALELLDRNGASKTSLLTSSCSVAISDDPDADEVAEAADLHNVKVVTPQWVLLSCKLQNQQQMDWFHPSIKKLFRGVTAFIAKVGRQDWFNLYALLSFRGAEMKCRLDNTVTHFVTTQGGGRLMDQLTQLKARVHVVLPDWVTDSVQHNVMQRESDYHPSRLSRVSAYFALTGSSAGSAASGPAMLSFGPTAASAVGGPQPVDVRVGSHVDNVPVMSVNIQQQQQQVQQAPTQQQQQQVTILTHNPNMMRVQQSQQSVAPGAVPVSHISAQPRFATSAQQQQSQPHTSQQQQQPFQMPFNDCPKYKQHWLDRIEARGGVTVQRYSPDRVTHVLLECLTCDEYFVALQDKKRIVSMNWLAACITKGTMEPPTELQHLPCIVDRQSSPSYCRDQVFAIHGFAVDDRLKLYYMIKSLGARYSPVLCATVSVLVCKKGDTDVVHKARGLGIAAAVENRKLMNSGDKKRKLEEAQADSTGSVKRIKLELAGAVNRDPANSSAAAAATRPVWQRPTDEPLLVAVSGLTKEDRTQCAQLCAKLGGRLLKDTESEKCQILVTPSLAVTPKLLLAVSSGVPIVNTDWLNESASAEAWLQPESFALSDTDGERQLGISLASVLESSRQNKLFSGYTFCLGPTCGGCGGAVRDDLIRKLINVNGGHIIERLPPADQCHSELAPKHLFVGTEEDCHCVHYLLRGKHGRLVAIQKVAIPYSTACVATTAASAATACGRCSSSLR